MHVDQATKEIKQRFDFKDSKTEITLKEKEKELVVVSDDEYKLNAVQDIIKAKCVKRGVSLKAFTYGSDGAGAEWDGAPGGEDSKWFGSGQGQGDDEGGQGVKIESASTDSRRASAGAEQEQG